jgi:hypothetical protein
MKKEFMLRGLLGIPIGITIGYLITIILSALYGDGSYSACVPQLTEFTGSEINAVILQAVLCGVLGFSFGSTCIFWKIERWSLAKQSGLFFLINSLVMMPIAYINYWMDHSLGGFLGYFGTFAIIFAIVWVVFYLIARRDVDQMNDRLKGSSGK